MRFSRCLWALGLCLVACTPPRSRSTADAGSADASVTAPVAAAGRADVATEKPVEAAAEPECKVAAGGKCCAPDLAAHLPKELIFSACPGAWARYQGEKGSSQSCKYVFRVEGAKPEEGTVELYVARVKGEVPATPTDPFFRWKKAGRAFYTEKALSPKSAPMLARATGLWMPGAGLTVSVTVPTKLCSPTQARKLATQLK